MKLFDAIRYGATLRGEHHVPCSPFIRVANSDELLSDVYGAACEAVYSLIAKRNWDKSDPLSYAADIEALREIQQKYFAQYFHMPANCSGAQQRQFNHAGGRFSGRVINGENEFIIEKEKTQIVGGVTSDCSLILNLAELVEHSYYAHNWTREECAQAVEWYEQQSAPLIAQNFTHYSDSTILKHRGVRMTNAAIVRARDRKTRAAQFWQH
jgi:hypothetical protein